MIKFILQPVIFDGALAASIALFAFLNSQFGSDEAAKFVAPVYLFWLRTFAGGCGAVALALKLYRSTGFAEYRQAKNGSYHTGDTQTFIKSNEKTTNPNPTGS